MPLNRDAYTRYRLIDERLRRKPYPSLEQLISHVAEGLDKPVSTRTIQLDIQEMRYSQDLKFTAPIVYHKAEKCYSYSDPNYSIHHLPVTADDLHGLEFAISILDQFRELPAIKEFEESIMKIAEMVRFNKQNRGEASVIQFDRPTSYKGIEYIEPLVKAIREQRRVKLYYQKFEEVTHREYMIEPYLVREYRSRFYLIGNVISAQGEKVKTFAFDRFIDLQLTERTFEGGFFDSEQYFANLYGISQGAGTQEHILLACTPRQGKYLQSQPLHHSQQVLKEDKKEWQISLEVSINPELVMQLLSYGAGVKVLQPASLVAQIRDEIEKARQLYEVK